MTELVRGDRFQELFTFFRSTAQRLETRDHYNSPVEQEPLRRFLEGNPDPEWANRPWLHSVRQAATEGRLFQRVRIVSLPLSGYARFGLHGAKANNAAGEDIRYLDRDAALKANIPQFDVWCFDRSLSAVLHFGEEDGALLGAELIDDPVVVAEHCRWFDLARKLSVSREEFAKRV
ncbi:DUF6879 family protein [Streptosporangium carneum]|uniref:DUF6879 domain-containing protein n=1 Tax=Streptosporangium carneum TaxID=47481 RepID=A0A9W6I4R1_9ACTN|nr:DUF6879 family protein [Streptosporangium carneum]GLK11138.1 hypothetical protein GCM10017600_45440 [Streptosporangium carneum]